MAHIFFFVEEDAVPYAIASLKHKSQTVRQSAALGLCMLGRRGLVGDQAVTALIESLSDPKEMVRFHALWALSEIGEASSRAVPALTKILANDNRKTKSPPNHRAAAAYALGKIGSQAKSGIPDLKRTLQERDSNLRGHAAVAIWRIDSDVLTALPVLLEEMPRTGEDGKWDWIIALGEMGPRAKEAVPQLKKELKDDTQSWVREYATNALKRIDPETFGLPSQE